MTYLRMKDMLEKFKCSRATIYRRVNDGVYPKPEYHGGTPMWVEEIVDAMLAANRQENLPTTASA